MNEFPYTKCRRNTIFNRMYYYRYTPYLNIKKIKNKNPYAESKGKMAEWFKAVAWRAIFNLLKHGFESLSFRF